MVKCYQVYKIDRLVTNIHQVDTRYTNVTRYTRDKRMQANYTIGQACPKWHLLHLDCLHWQSTTKALKDQRKNCLPKWDTQNFPDPHHNKQLDKIFNN